MYKFCYKGIMIFGKLTEDIFGIMDKAENELYDGNGINNNSRIWLMDKTDKIVAVKDVALLSVQGGIV